MNNSVKVEIPEVITGENVQEVVREIETEIKKQDLPLNENVKVEVPEGTKVFF